MKSTRTDLLRPGQITSDTEKLHIYNGLDCCVTLEVLEKTLPLFDNVTSSTYAFSRALQAPIMEMNLRGVLIDERERQKAIKAYQADNRRLEQQLYNIIHDGVGFTAFCNIGKTKAWRSNQQIAALLYDTMRLPEVRKRNDKGELVRTVNREALEKLQQHFLAQPIIGHILALRDIGKKISTLETEVDPDGRVRTSYNIAGTTTGRLSSSFNDFGTGGNLQNIEERLRRIFIADSGMKFANLDLEQADSRNIGALCWNVFRDSKYLDACEGGDLHTTVSRIMQPAMPWTGDPRTDREIAERPFYRHYSLRYMSKKGGHGTNYLGSDFEIARQTKIERSLIKEFQRQYLGEGGFPAIARLHDWIKQRLIEDRYLITPFGRKRWFFGHPEDRDTLKQAVAHMGQSMTADEMNLAMLAVWRMNIAQLLLQVHDSILIQYPEEQEDEILSKILPAMRVPLELEGGRQFVVPAEAKVGWNWANHGPENPNGLKKYSGYDGRSRVTEA